MKRNNLLLAFAVILLMASCKSDKKTVIATQPEDKETVAAVNKGNINFENYFLDKTMRLDYFHSGTAKEEHFAKDRVVSDGIWSGSRKSLIKKRDATNNFSTVWTTDIDPASRQVNPADIIHTNKIDVISEKGTADQKVDIVMLGDGYSKDEMAKFRKDAARLSGYLMNAEPFKSRSNDFNIRAIETPGESSGVNKPHQGVFKRTPLSVHYSSFDSERYALTCDNRTVRDIASQVSYDLMVIMVNERTYGGGGIYNLYTTVSADNKFAEYIMVHEMGHHMAALADEYYTSSVSYEVPEVKVEPWETNITALFDKTNLKWKDLIEEGIPLPTPWNKEEFDKFGYSIQKERDSLRAAMVPETVMEELFTRQMNKENEYFTKEKYRDQVGAFEGAGYLAKGLYRPQVDCIMYTRHLTFCKVCRRSIERVIDQYVR